MKNLLFATFILTLSISANAQESLIADIMQVAPVELTIGEEEQKLIDAYDADFAEEQTLLEEELTKNSEDYAAEITKMIETFTDLMDKGEERAIRNEKQRINSASNASTYALLKTKKQTIQNFHNKMMTAMKELPRQVHSMKEKELSDVVSECRKNNDLEFEANQRVLKAFKATEHITKKHISDMPSSPSEEGN